MVIILKDITKKFRNTTAVKGLSVEIREGELVCLLGPSGCGKSTTLSMIAGLEPPTKGDIFFDGKRVNQVEAEDRDIGMVFQNYALYPHMTVGRNIEFPLRMRHIAKAQREERVRAVAGMMQIEDLLNRRPSQLSGGQQQRVAIARALVKRPKILLLDEPFSNLDARLRIELRDEIRSLQKQLGITTIFVTHDQEEAMSISDRILLLKEGVMQQYSTPKDMYTHPANRFTAGFLGNPPINFLTCRMVGGKLMVQDCGHGSMELPVKKCVWEQTGLPEEQADLEAGVRPEDIYVVASQEHSDFRGRVIAVQTLGKEIYLKVETWGHRLTACVSWDHNYGIGDVINLAVKKIYLFPEKGETECNGRAGK